MRQAQNLNFFISAGEYSGDLLGADLIHQWKKSYGMLRPFGMGGSFMRQAGAQVVVDCKRFSVMGLWDVIKQLADFRIAEKELLAKVDAMHPAFALLIDFPGLHFRLAEQLKLRGIPVYQYCAPKVWAWGENRIKDMQSGGLFRKVLGILPFEEEFFIRHKVDYHYVGTPQLDRCLQVNVKKEDFGFLDSEKIIALLPGSRQTEFDRIFPRLMQIKKALEQKDPSYRFVLALAPNLDQERCRKLIANHDGTQRLRVFSGMSLELMAIARSAVVASGTATLECALLKTPMAVVYEMDPETFALAKDRVKVKYASLVNLLSGQEVVKEFLQYFDEEDVAQYVHLLNSSSDLRCSQVSSFENIISQLRPNAAKTTVGLLIDDLRTLGLWHGA